VLRLLDVSTGKSSRIGPVAAAEIFGLNTPGLRDSSTSGAMAPRPPREGPWPEEFVSVL